MSDAVAELGGGAQEGEGEGLPVGGTASGTMPMKLFCYTCTCVMLIPGPQCIV